MTLAEHILQQPCAYCGAVPGARCVTVRRPPVYHTLSFTQPHMNRYNAGKAAFLAADPGAANHLPGCARPKKYGGNACACLMKKTLKGTKR